MELQNRNIQIPMSIFYNLMGTLLDYLLLAVRLLTNMSSPIYEHYHCAPPRGPARSLWKHKQQEKVGTPEPESSKAADVDHCAEPLATMISLQMMAIDVIDQIQVQEALHQCATSQSSPKPKTTTTSGIEMKAFPPCGAPTFCYFFIDMQSKSIPLCKGPQEEFDDTTSYSQRSNDRNNNADAEVARRLQRQRSVSECSEDSFICFEDDVDDNGAVTSNGWCDDADDNEPDADDDDDDNDDEDDDDDDDTTDEVCDCDNISTKSPKKVRFNLKPDVHVMRTWNFAYRAARKGDWQVYSRDRDRFQQRINRLAPILSTILSSNHREKVYNDRFSM